MDNEELIGKIEEKVRDLYHKSNAEGISTGQAYRFGGCLSAYEWVLNELGWSIDNMELDA
jgi:hypothetical protein